MGTENLLKTVFDTNLQVDWVSRKADSRADGAPEESIPGLVRLAQAGDGEAFGKLVDRFQRQAMRVAYRLLNNRDDAMDVVQDAFLRAWDRLDSLSNPGAFGAWFLRILGNRSLNFRRSRALRRTASLDSARDEDDSLSGSIPDGRVEKPADRAEQGDFVQAVQKAIASLPDAQRMALVLFCIEKLPQKRVAEILECSVETVKWNVFAARKKLKGQLEEYL